MNDSEQNLFEQELGRLRPAAPPLELMQRLAEARPTPVSNPRNRRSATPVPWLILRWLLPATAMLVAAAFAWKLIPARPGRNQATAPVGPAVKADHVQINQELVNSFEAVAVLPGGEPVRFRCLEWVEDMTVRDKDRGLLIEERRPRVEVVPVRFETY